MSRRARKSPPRRRSHGATRRAQRPKLWESIQGANKRAHHRANQRSGRRRGLTSVHAAIADTYEDDYSLPTGQLVLRSLLALLLILPSAISTLALFTIAEHTGQSNFWLDLLRSRAFIFFFTGCFLMCGWFYSKLLSNFFLYLYVLGHELTHVLFIYICGGKVSGFNVTLDGGYVMTNKSNILIALSPYFVPFWSFIVLLISGLLRLFWDIWMIPRDQPDLKENGTFFSLVLIYLANVLLLATMLCLVPGGLNFKSYAIHWVSIFSKVMDSTEALLQQVVTQL